MFISKPQLRSEALRRRSDLSVTMKRTFSDTIALSLLDYLNHQAADEHHLLLYRSLPDEVNTDSVFESFPYRIYAPRVRNSHEMHWLRVDQNTHWLTGTFGIQEPEKGDDWGMEESPAVLVCPLVAFDRAGNRLGMGKGCFDRWLDIYRPRIDLIVGLAFACQEVDTIPVDLHDIPMDVVITENEVIPCRK